VSDERVRVADSPVTHVVSWSSDVGGHTRCGLGFAWDVSDPRTEARLQATIVDDDCDCMTCLVKEDRMVGFQAYQDVGMSVANVRALAKLDFPAEEPKK
jgi:hypothetical protein